MEFVNKATGLKL